MPAARLASPNDLVDPAHQGGNAASLTQGGGVHRRPRLRRRGGLGRGLGWRRGLDRGHRKGTDEGTGRDPAAVDRLGHAGAE
eukprot:4064274-Alexandrium_andersonii.AAC.1